MRMRIFFLCLGLFALAIPPFSPAQQAILLVRHAEKAANSMKDKDTPLSQAGEERARLLARMLKDSGITAIYATDTVRTHATAQPLANALHLSIKNLEQHDPEGAVRRLKKENPNDVVLIVGHSDTLPGLLQALGYQREVKIRNDDYTNLFIVVPRAGKPSSVIHVTFGEDEAEPDARRENPLPRSNSHSRAGSP
jgi:broad specificity phosphatase PhoE